MLSWMTSLLYDHTVKFSCVGAAATATAQTTKVRAKSPDAIAKYRRIIFYHHPLGVWMSACYGTDLTHSDAYEPVSRHHPQTTRSPRATGSPAARIADSLPIS